MRREVVKSELVQRIRQLAEKREKQAETAGNRELRNRLQDVARNYRALAEEVAREIALPAPRAGTPAASI